ncbi:MAG: hypothetical protein LJE95_13385 [Acidobacteria bacterium]|nr:hypothetical protein [Acidobacteriota bacterium]
MAPDPLDFYLNRMARAYQEQVWAVALVGGLCVFVAAHAERLLGAFNLWTVTRAVVLLSVLTLAFVWSRHFIFVNYDRRTKAALESAASGSVDGVPPALAALARWSGISLYSLIVIGLAVTALRMLAVANGKMGG